MHFSLQDTLCCQLQNWGTYLDIEVYKILSEDAQRYGMTYVQNPMELSRTQLRTEITEGENVVESYRIINDKKPNKI